MVDAPALMGGREGTWKEGSKDEGEQGREVRMKLSSRPMAGRRPSLSERAREQAPSMP